MTSGSLLPYLWDLSTRGAPALSPSPGPHAQAPSSLPWRVAGRAPALRLLTARICAVDSPSLCRCSHGTCRGSFSKRLTQ